MPLIKLEISGPVDAQKKQQILAESSRILAEVTGKPERYVMATLAEAAFVMAGEAGLAAFIDIRGIGGLTKAVNGRLAQELCGLLQRELNIEPARVYLNFSDIAAANWGWNGATFG